MDKSEDLMRGAAYVVWEGRRLQMVRRIFGLARH